MSETVQNRLEEAEHTSQGPGRVLREARKIQQLDQAELAQRLNLDLKVIDAIERGDFAALPPPTFIKGYLRAYARAVGVDPQTVLDDYDRLTDKPSNEAIDIRRYREPEPIHGPSELTIRWVMLAVIVLLVGGVAAYVTVRGVGPLTSQSGDQAEDGSSFLSYPFRRTADASAEDVTAAADRQQGSLSAPDRSSESGDSATSVGDVATPAPSPVASDASVADNPTTTSVPAAADAASATTTPTADRAAEPDSAVAFSPESASQSLNAVAPEQPETPTVIGELVFSEDCWTSVQAGDGERLVYRVVKAGSRVPLVGVAPFSVTLGNARAVQVSFAGLSVDISPHTRGNIARFTLPLPPR